ncbi:MAG: hypothetical protein F6K42_01165 [Leptolyngbya sp. SIO1D8]|nr:hypothetical protein [Leptolyngbya sp. SIO1D8]
MGACINVKWNGAGYFLALWCLEGIRRLRHWAADTPQTVTRPWLWLGVLPLGTYLLCWLPYLDLTGYTLWEIHQYLWQFHQQAGDHPYQSIWYTWPFMIRPIAYFYQGLNGNEPLGIGPPTPSPEKAIALYGMDNPFLLWFGSAAIVLLMLQIVDQCRRHLQNSIRFSKSRKTARTHKSGDSPKREALNTNRVTHASHRQVPVTVSIVMVYLANWLPWTLIQRSTFFYHYLSSALMGAVAIAWLMSRWFTGDRASWRWAGWGILGLLLAGFLFWLPLWIGGTLPMEALQQRWWLPTWR